MDGKVETASEKIWYDEPDVWLFLSRCLSYPTMSLLEFLGGEGEVFRGTSLEGLFEWVSQWSSLDDCLEQLEEEYTRLFITSFPTLVAPPYESSYRKDKTPSEILRELVYFYRSCGFSPMENEGRRLDHVVNGCRCSAYLLLNERPDHLEQYREEHFDRFLTAYSERLHAAADVPLYRVFAGILGAYSEDRNNVERSKVQ